MRIGTVKVLNSYSKKKHAKCLCFIYIDGQGDFFMHKKLERIWNALLSIIIIIVLVPLMVTIVYQRMELESVLHGMLPEEYNVNMETLDDTESEAQKTGQDLENNDLVDSEEWEQQKIIGIVAKEINVNSSEHAIFAQCVIARTNYYDAKRAGTTEPDSFTLVEMKELWGEAFDAVYAKLKDCVKQTQGEVLMYQGNYIYAAYHAVSAGKTRSMEEIYPDTNMPYLAEHQCQEDINAEGYLGVLYWGEEEFLEQCKELFPESDLKSVEQIVVQKRDSAGYVTEIMIGSHSYTGEEFRSRWELASACFSVANVDERVRIVTKGLGHGLGLSQYTANQMAKEGKDYREILAYFYPGTSIEKM